MGPELIPALLLSGVGTAMQMSAQRDAQKERRSILNRQLEETDRATDKSLDMVQQEAKNFDQQSRLEQMQQAEAKGFQQAQADMQGAGGGGAVLSTATEAGNVSDDFLKTKAAQAITEGNRLTAIAREAAKTRAPGRMRLDDSLRMAALSGDLENVWGGARNIARSNSLDAQAVQEPGYGALGSIASAIGTGMGMRAMNTPTATPGVPPNPYVTGPYRTAPAGINFGGR